MDWSEVHFTVFFFLVSDGVNRVAATGAAISSVPQKFRWKILGSKMSFRISALRLGNEDLKSPRVSGFPLLTGALVDFERPKLNLSLNFECSFLSEIVS